MLYFLNKASALHGFVQGGSKNAPVGRSIQIGQLMAAALGAQTWFKFVDSEANWCDGASRTLFCDEFCHDHGSWHNRARVRAHWLV